MAVVESSSGQIFYEVKGRGEPIVLIRGLGRSSQYWLGFDDYLAKHFKVIIVDQRGIGKSSAKLAWNDSIDDLSHDLIPVIDGLNISRVIVFGLSLGGMIALSFAANFPERCRGVIVANASTADRPSFRINPLAVLKLGIAAVKGNFQQNLLSLLTTEKIVANLGDEIGELWQEIADEESIPIESMCKQLISAARFRIKGKLDADTMPTLIIYGNQDQFVPKRNSKLIQSLIPNSKLKIIRGAGHEISIGWQKELTEMIIDFTKKLPPSNVTPIKSRRKQF